MMKKLLWVLALAVLLPSAATIADEHETAPQHAYGTYFECDPNREWLADAIVEQLFKPVYDQAVEDGTISGWGYLVHHTGGNWRRVMYHIAPTVDAALSAAGTLGEKASEINASAAAEFGAICGAHDDYLWRTVVGSAGTEVAQERGAVGFSTYFHCDEANEAQADEVVKTVLAPIYNAQVEAGNLVSWGYMEHWVGGEYRRLLSLTAADMSSLMAGRDGAANAVLSDMEKAAGFFDSCKSHSDYIWTIRHETP